MTVLRSGLNPKMTLATVAPTGAGIQTAEYDVIDMRDSMSWSISADQEHPTLDGYIQIDWFIIERLAVRIWTDRFRIPPLGVQLQARGPCISPYCKITIGIPKQAAATTQLNFYFFGTNQVYENATFQFDDTLSNPANSLGFQNIAIIDPDTIAAGYAAVLTNDPALADAGLVTRSFLVGESTGGLSDTATVRTTDPVANNAGLVVRPLPVAETPITWDAIDSTVGGAGEALLSMNRHDNFGAAVAASSYTVPAGKLLIIHSFLLIVRQTAAAGATLAIIRLRTTAALTGDVIIAYAGRHANADAVQDSAGEVVPLVLPHGIQVPAGQQFCFSAEQTGTASRHDTTIAGVLISV